MPGFGVMALSQLFVQPARRSRAQTKAPGGETATLRALVDVGESIVSSVHVIYSSVRLYLCVTMEVKPDALAAQAERDRRTAGHCLYFITNGAKTQDVFAIFPYFLYLQFLYKSFLFSHLLQMDF